MGSITPQQGVAALGRLLDGDAAQAAVLNVRRGGWQNLRASIGQTPMLAELARDNSGLCVVTSICRSSRGSQAGWSQTGRIMARHRKENER